MTTINGALAYTDGPDVWNLAGAVGSVVPVPKLSFGRSIVAMLAGETITLNLQADGPFDGATVIPSSLGGTFNPPELAAAGSVQFTATSAGSFAITTSNDGALADVPAILLVVGTPDGHGGLASPEVYDGARSPVSVPHGDLEVLAREIMVINPRLFEGYNLGDLMNFNSKSFEIRLRQHALFALMSGIAEA